MKNFLITGALGFIGSNVANYLSLKYPHIRIIILDKLSYCSSKHNIDKTALHNIKIIIGDISNVDFVSFILEEYKIDHVIHFAASSHVANSFYNSIDFTLNNVLGTHYLLETVRVYHEKTNAIEKFIHISTDEVYGEVTDDVMRKETSILVPTNPYASTKASAEHMVNSYYISYGLPIIITRSNNVYGINQYPEKIIPKFICQMINGEKITIEGNGSSKRNFIHVNDISTAIETIILKGQIGETYNICAPDECEYDVMTIAKTIIELFGYESNDINNYLKFVEDRKFNDCRYYIDASKLKSLGWESMHTNFNENVMQLIEWYKQNKNRYSM
jgi:dTDP-glucose 4,6-dehydratase